MWKHPESGLGRLYNGRSGRLRHPDRDVGGATPKVDCHRPKGEEPQAQGGSEEVQGRVGGREEAECNGSHQTQREP